VKDQEGLFLGLQFGLTILMGLAVGVWLDHRFKWEPVGTLVGFFGGALVGFYNLIKKMK